MKLIEDARMLAQSEDFKADVSADFFENIVAAVTGDAVALAKALLFIKNSPGYIRERLFWEKFLIFLESSFLDEDDVRKLSEIFTEKEEQEEYARRIIRLVDDIDVNRKAKYLSNLTRALLNKHISKEHYYRLCSALTSSLFEDLIFIQENISKKHLKYSLNIDFLEKNSLVYQSVIDGGTLEEDNVAPRNEYEFTPFAYMLYKYGLAYDEQYSYNEPKEQGLAFKKKQYVSADIQLGIRQW